MTDKKKKKSSTATAEPLRKEAKSLYGYLTSSGYMGLVEGEWMLFATETDYLEYMTG